MAVIKGEDFVEYPVIMEGMLNESLLLFCTRFNYGANFHDMFHELFQHEYTYKGSIIRRSPGTGIIRAEELFFAINLDAMPSPIEIPSEVWKYAFEVPEKSSLPFRVRPDTTVKVALFSVQQGLVLIAPISLLLLLCQRQFSMEMVREPTIVGLSKDWGQIYGLLDNCEQIIGNKSDKTPATPVSTLDLCLYLPSENIDNLLEILGRNGPHPLKDFVEECWGLTIETYNRREGKYAPGNVFQWRPYFIRDQSRLDLLEEWVNSRRIRRCSKLSESYSINFEYVSVPGNNPSVAASWQTAKLPLFRPEDMWKPNPVNLLDEQEYLVQEMPYAPVPTLVKYYKSSTLRDFASFYRDEFNRLLKVVEWHGPYLLLRESEVYDRARETREGQEKWAKQVAEAQAKKIAEKGKKGEVTEGSVVTEEAPVPMPVPLVMSVKQSQEVQDFVNKLKDLREQIDDLVDVRSKMGYTINVLFEIFEELLRVKTIVEKYAGMGIDMSKIDAEYFSAYDKFVNFVTPRRMDEWYFGNVPTSNTEEDKTGLITSLYEIQFKDVILKDGGDDFLDQHHLAGVQSFLSLATSSGHLTRYFSCTPKGAIQEERMEFWQEATRGWLAKALGVFRDLACCVLSLLENGLIINLSWGDILANDYLKELQKSPDCPQYITARWRYDNVLEVYKKFTEEELRLYKTLLKNSMEHPAAMNATVEHLQWELLRKENPAAYVQIAKEVNEIKESVPKSDEQLVAEKEDLEQEDGLPEEMQDEDREGWEVIQETDAWIKYRTPDGSIIIEPTDLAREAEGFKREYLNEEDEDEEE